MNNKLILLLSTLSILSRPGTAHERQVYNTAAEVTSAGSGSIYNTRFPNVTWNNDDWQLSTTNLDQGHYQSRISVANGYHGINVASLGPFFEYDISDQGTPINGWPLFDRRQTFATIGYFWDSQPQLNGSNYPWLSQYGWDTAISGIPHWSGIIMDLGDSDVLNASTSSDTISNFISVLDMKRGVMNWAFTWTTGKGTFDVTYQMFAHKVQINQGLVNMTIKARNDANATIVNVLNGDCALRTQMVDKGEDNNFIYSAVHPNGVPNVTAYVYAGMAISGAQMIDNLTDWDAPYVGDNQSSIAAAFNVKLQAGQAASFTKYVGIASSDGFDDPQKIAGDAARIAMQTGYMSSIESHAAEWAAIFPDTSVDRFTYPENGTLPDDPYVIEAAITAVTNPYHIIQNTISENATTAVANASINSHSIAVGGLGSESYAGQIFWDAETWMQPGIVAAFPYAAQGIANYRLKIHSQAVQNTQTSYTSSKNDTSFSANAAIYPWTSGRVGNCTATGPCWDYQYHLNGDIILAMTNQWLASGSEDFMVNSLYPVQQSLATTLSELLIRNGSLWALANMTDPDEYANNVDNGAYTMAQISDMLDFANAMREHMNDTANGTWADQAQNILIGKSEIGNISLEYTGPIPMNNSVVVKQADVVLISYPLSYSSDEYTSENALIDLDYYANKQSSDGPGMTYAIFSIIANEVSPSGCSAYTYQQYSYQPYVRGPWFQFSEQEIDDPAINGGTNPAFPFLTGHGGANQVILFGYLGLRYVPDGFLHLDPAPPQQLPNIDYRTFYWQGWPIQARSNATHTIITRGPTTTSPPSGTSPNSTFINASIPVMIGPLSGEQTLYQLPVDGSLVVRNRQYYLNKTVANNIAQCQHVTSQDEFLPGQFPISAVDGASSTRWQPALANQTASITVQLPPGLAVQGFMFDWGMQPPYNYSITFTDDPSATSANSRLVYNESQVAISEPYNANASLAVQPVIGNTTSVMLDATNQQNTQQLVTIQFATLSIWGNQMNGSLTADTMSGDGATVAEWSIIVSNGTSGSTIAAANRRASAMSDVMRKINRSKKLR